MCMIREKYENHELDDNSKMWSDAVRSEASYLDSLLEELPSSREKSLAVTKLEECVMWANKCIALHGAPSTKEELDSNSN